MMQDIGQYLVQIVLLLPIFLLSLSFHEFSHGYVSYLLGDPTAKRQGRLTLNPLAHLDPMGTLVLIITRMFGWAKPVPIDPRHYKDRDKGIILVSIAGPAANFLLAIIFAVLLRLVFARYNLVMRGSGIFGPADLSDIVGLVVTMIQTGVFLNIALAIFNLIPIPPLDGSKILRGILPRKYNSIFDSLEGGAGMIILVLLLFTGVLGRIIQPVMFFFMRLLGPG